MSYWRMRQQAELYKKMTGRPYKKVPAELIQLEEDIARKRGEIAASKAAGVEEKKLSQEQADLAVLENQYRQAMKAFESQPSA